MNNTLDIITVTKDDFNGLVATVNSTRLLRSNFDITQIIVDSSDKGIKQKIQLFLTNEKNIEYLWEEPAGIAHGFNTGLRRSTAQWVWFLNGGDQAHPDIDNFIKIVKQSKADAIIFDFELVPSGSRPAHPPLWALWPPISTWIPHPATLTRRHLYEQYGMFNGSYEIAMDFDFWLRCFSKQVRVDMLSIPLARFDTNGRSYANNTKTSREVISIIQKHFWNIIRIWLMNGVFILRALWFHFRRSKGAAR